MNHLQNGSRFFSYTVDNHCELGQKVSGSFAEELHLESLQHQIESDLMPSARCDQSDSYGLEREHLNSQYGNQTLKDMNCMVAFHKLLDSTMNHSKTKVIFQGISLTHYH
nr:uncharacterized protein LOC125420620 [Ziziphus jujuba var. spinosa]